MKGASSLLLGLLATTVFGASPTPIFHQIGTQSLPPVEWMRHFHVRQTTSSLKMRDGVWLYATTSSAPPVSIPLDIAKARHCGTVFSFPEGGNQISGGFLEEDSLVLYVEVGSHIWLSSLKPISFHQMTGTAMDTVTGENIPISFSYQGPSTRFSLSDATISLNGTPYSEGGSSSQPSIFFKDPVAGSITGTRAVHAGATSDEICYDVAGSDGASISTFMEPTNPAIAMLYRGFAQDGTLWTMYLFGFPSAIKVTEKPSIVSAWTSDSQMGIGIDVFLGSSTK